LKGGGGVHHKPPTFQKAAIHKNAVLGDWAADGAGRKALLRHSCQKKENKIVDYPGMYDRMSPAGCPVLF